jgi:hypothetical protein
MIRLRTTPSRTKGSSLTNSSAAFRGVEDRHRAFPLRAAEGADHEEGTAMAELPQPDAVRRKDGGRSGANVVGRLIEDDISLHRPSSR